MADEGAASDAHLTLRHVRADDDTDPIIWHILTTERQHP